MSTDNIGSAISGTLLYNSSALALDLATYGYNSASQRIAFTNAAGTYVQYSYNIGHLQVAASSSS